MASPPEVLAFVFGSHLLLSGLGLATIPLLIHLLYRQDFVKTRWAAMRFLMQACQKRPSRSRIDQLLLLLLRMSVIAAFVLTLARPMWDVLPNISADKAATHYILVFDASYSMQFQEVDAIGSSQDDGQTRRLTRFEKAQQQALELVSKAQTGDLWSILRVADDGVAADLSHPSASAEFITQEIQGLKVSDASGDLSIALQSLLAIARQVPDVPKKRIVVFTDMQEIFLMPLAGTENSIHHPMMSELKSMAILSIVDVSNGPSPNIAVTELRSDRSYGLLDRPSRVFSVIRSTGSMSPLRGQLVDLLIDGRIIETKRIDLPANIFVSVDWQFQIQSPGEHLIEVRVEDDSLPIDNRRSLLLPVRNDLRVLAVEPLENGTTLISPTTAFYVTRGLAPQLESKLPSSPIRPTLIWSTEFSSTRLDEVDVVILCGTWRMNEREIHLLEDFVRDGGGLVVVIDDTASLDSANEGLYRNGTGLLAGKLIGHEKNEGIGGALYFDASHSKHPLLREFQRNPGSGLESVLVFRYAKLEPSAGANVILHLNNAAPAIVERHFGRGRSVVFTTGPRSDWSTWGALGQSFVPLLHEAVLRVVRDSDVRQIEVGRTAMLRYPSGATLIAPRLHAPDGALQSLKTLREGQWEHIVLDGITHSGLYCVDYGSSERPDTRIVSAVNAEEGILTDQNQLRQSGTGVGPRAVELLAGGNAGFGAVPLNVHSDSGIPARAGLFIVLLLMLGESLLAARVVALSWGWGLSVRRLRL